MKKLYWLLLIMSAVLYALPFLFSQHVWWLVFIFPVPLLYIMRVVHLSFIHGFLWGCITFALHLSGGIYLIVAMAGEAWYVGLCLGIAMVLYQALSVAVLFWCAAHIIRLCNIRRRSPGILLGVWTIVLMLFIVWTDWYSLWIFGVTEGYPLMQPLILLGQKPALLRLMPIIGKQLLTVLFLLVSVGCVLLLWHKNGRALFFLCAVLAPWLLCLWADKQEIRPLHWYCQVKSLPYMACSTVEDPTVMVKIVRNLLKNIITQHPQTELIIMPESAFNVSNFVSLSELLQLWDKNGLGKAIHLVFGAPRWHNNHYYNSLHWVYNGELQNCFDKKHAMLMSERLSSWMECNVLRRIYFNQTLPINVSSADRTQLSLLDDIVFVPYICSEFFFSALPDDDHGNAPILVIVNDLLFVSSGYSAYIQKLLVLLAQCKAVQWQRDIVYVSYAQSLFINKHGMLHEM